MFKSLLAKSQLLNILGHVPDFFLGIIYSIIVIPDAISNTTCFEEILLNFLIISTDNLGVTMLILWINELFFLIFCRDLPLIRIYRLTVCLKIVDFQEVEAPIFILQEVTDEFTQRPLGLWVKLRLIEDLVHCVDWIDNMWIWVWHAFIPRVILTRVNIDGKEVPQLSHRESSLQLHQILFIFYLFITFVLIVISFTMRLPCSLNRNVIQLFAQVQMLLGFFSLILLPLLQSFRTHINWTLSALATVGPDHWHLFDNWDCLSISSHLVDRRVSYQGWWQRESLRLRAIGWMSRD